MEQAKNDHYIEKLHAAELEIMDAIASVCAKLNLKYVIFAGSLLGAIRHQGFIPWDDDIDVIMPREDYDIFVKEAQNHMESKFIVQHYSTEPKTNALWAKVRNKNTVFIEDENQDYDICHGIFVDVFPFDKIKTGKRSYKTEFRKRNRYNKICGCYSQHYIDSIIRPCKRAVAKIIKKFICDKKPIGAFVAKEDMRRKRLNKTGDDCYPIHFFEDRGTLTYHQLFDSIDMKFEDRVYKGPKNYELCLKKMYGENYMQLPPEEKRITHKPLRVIFEE